jgi:hypothetical protein
MTDSHSVETKKATTMGPDIRLVESESEWEQKDEYTGKLYRVNNVVVALATWTGASNQSYICSEATVGSTATLLY